MMGTGVRTVIGIFLHIYLYIERERDIYLYIYVYISYHIYACLWVGELVGERIWAPGLSSGPHAGIGI